MTQPCFQHLSKFPILLPSPMPLQLHLSRFALQTYASVAVSFLTHPFQFLRGCTCRAWHTHLFILCMLLPLPRILFSFKGLELSYPKSEPLMRSGQSCKWLHNIAIRKQSLSTRGQQAWNVFLCAKVSTCWEFSKESFRIYPTTLYLMHRVEGCALIFQVCPSLTEDHS